MTVSFSKLGNHGRFGNTLFQMAATIALAERNNDTYIFPNNQYKHWFLKPGNCFTDKINIKEIYEEPHFHYTPIPYKKNLDLFGYFQSERYFADHAGIIRNLFMPNCSINKLLSDIASIHVRRGDYLQPHLSGCFNILGMNYYRKAMEIIKADKYMIFSDDILWCRKNFVGKQFIFADGVNPIADFGMMISCNGHIIANSSFSWWAAWLNPNKDKKIVAPLNWFGPKLKSSHNTKDLIPSRWIRI